MGDKRLERQPRRTAAANGPGRDPSGARRAARRLTRSVTFVGLMGAGKSAIGRRVAEAIGAAFYDSDDEIERAAGMSIPEIFERYGEAHFREGERRVIARLLSGDPLVLATGGGAFVDDASRALILEQSLVVWLRADLETLVERCSRRSDRPLLRQGDPREILDGLIAVRHPIYAQAHSIVDSVNGPHETIVAEVLRRLEAWGATAGQA